MQQFSPKLMKIGVFDSGKGGLSVANAIKADMPAAEIIFMNDTQNVPYGSKSPDELLLLVRPILEQLVDNGCEVIVIACNTVTTTLIQLLRERIAVPLVGIEPMIKPAALTTRSGIIAVCATPTTLKSQRYAYLKETFAKHVTILQPDCSRWASMIENNSLDRASIHADINKIIAQGADVIVLACTHYHWIEALITEIASGRAVIMQPESATIAQLKRVIEQLS